MVGLIERPIDPAEVYASVQNSRYGAVVVFTGVVRERSDDGRPVTALTYEAYRDLAVAEMERVAQEVHARFDPCDVAMQHRTGTLALGEVSVIVAVASAHRSAAFEACRYGIDELKRRVPIWKKEQFVDGEPLWRGNAP